MKYWYGIARLGIGTSQLLREQEPERNPTASIQIPIRLIDSANSFLSGRRWGDNIKTSPPTSKVTCQAMNTLMTIAGTDKIAEMEFLVNILQKNSQKETNTSTYAASIARS